MNARKKYILPLVLGFAGMFICHFGLFVCTMAGIPFMAYLIVYPIVYPLLTALLTSKEPQLWLTNAIFLLVIPALYWYALLWSDGRLNAASFSLLESSGMSVIILITLAFSLVAALAIARMKRVNKSAA